MKDRVAIWLYTSGLWSVLLRMGIVSNRTIAWFSNKARLKTTGSEVRFWLIVIGCIILWLIIGWVILVFHKLFYILSRGYRRNR